MTKSAGLKNNDGMVVRPRGRPACSFSVVPDLILTDKSITSSARLVLAYIAGKPPNWVACVTDICKQLGLTNSQWRTARDSLRRVGIIPVDHPKRVGGGQNKFTWVLDLLLERYYLRELSTGHHPKIADGFHQRFSIDRKVADKQEESTTKKPPPPAVVASCLTEKEKAMLAGMTESEQTRISVALANATTDQRAAFINVFTACRPRARSPVGLAVSLARAAAKGELQGSAEQQHGLDAITICANHESWRGQLCDPTGVHARADGDIGGQLRDQGGALLSISDSAAAWRRVDVGELDFVGV